MITVSLPQDLEGPLQAEAQRQGIPPETLALNYLRQRFAPETLTPPTQAPQPTNLAEFLADQIGAIAGSHEAYSENCGQRFAEGIAEQQ